MTEPLIKVAPAPRPRVEEHPWVPPLDALQAFRGTRHPALLLSALEDHPASRFSILASDPVVVASWREGAARLVWAGPPPRVEVRAAKDPFDFLRTLAPEGAVGPPPGGLPFAGGAIGFLAYGLRRHVERLPIAPPDPLGLPEAWFGVYDAAVIFDHRDRRVFLVAAGIGATGERERAALGSAAMARLRGRLAAAPPAALIATAPAPPGPHPARGLPPVTRAIAATPRADYLEAVRRSLGLIAAGDVYQVNLSHRIDCAFDGDPVDLFRALAERNPAPFAAYLDGGEFRLASASPERFVALRDGLATSSPIKGTRPRAADPAEDRRLALELLRSAKDRAENVMIADLVRNDLGRVCAAGTVGVPSLCGLESFATVHHLVSTVTGRLRPERDRIDLLKALFPAGSMTGAPKVRAMEIIDSLEREERGVYSGSIGYLSLDGGMDFNIVIRTAVLVPGRASLRVGGGIVADSDPAAEHRETLDKAGAVLDALGARLGAGDEARPAPTPRGREEGRRGALLRSSG